MLKLEAMSCGYGAARAVHEASLELPAQSILSLLGPNGAGKTSTIMAIMGHLDIHSGRIFFEGQDITRRRALDRARLGIALVPEGRQIFPDLSVDENLTVGGYAFSAAGDRGKRQRVFDLFPRLHDRRAQIASSLSGGEQQMLAIGRALMAEPRLLLIDELSLGLMPKMVDTFLDALLRLRREGLTILLVEQNTKRALDVADRVCVLSSGRLVFSGSAAEAKADEGLMMTLLGLSERSSA
jgi:branched-chain amino acid transport system ATP-binding protein